MEHNTLADGLMHQRARFLGAPGWATVPQRSASKAKRSRVASQALFDRGGSGDGHGGILMQPVGLTTPPTERRRPEFACHHLSEPFMAIAI
ncbi:MAG: hypothetical protein EA413_12450, partial [Cyanobium sp. PLM2.Bin73]